MTPTEQIDTKELRRLAEKLLISAPWKVQHPYAKVKGYEISDRTGLNQICQDIDLDDAAYIAAANPAAILALLDDRDALKQRLAHAQMAADAEARDRDEWRERALRAEAAAGAVPEGLREAMVELMNSDQNIAGATDDELRAAANNPDCNPVVRVQAKAVLKARAALAAAPSAPVAAPNPDANENAPWLTLAHMICADAGIPSGHIAGRLEALREKLAVAAQAKPVEVRVRDGRVWIVKGNQSFMLAYDADTDEEREWYAGQLRAVLSSITPDVKIVTPEAGKDAVVEAARAWWEMRRPINWTEAQHRTNAEVNCATPSDAALARAIATSKETQA